MPSADVLGVIIGILFIIPTIYFIRTKDWDKVAWPFFLITLPVYYMLFGVLEMDGTAILNEFLYGLPVIITGLLAWHDYSNRTHVWFLVEHKADILPAARYDMARCKFRR